MTRCDVLQERVNGRGIRHDDDEGEGEVVEERRDMQDCAIVHLE